MPLDDDATANFTDPFADVGARLDSMAPKPPQPQFSWLGRSLRTISEIEGGEDWLKAAPARREYLLTMQRDGKDLGVLAAGRVAFLASAGGVGKSHALCQLALAVAVADVCKTEWLGAFHVEKAGRVLLAMGEEEESEVRRRLFDAAAVMHLNPRQREEAMKRIVPMCLAGRDDVALTRELEPGAEGTSETAFSIDLRKALEAHPWACIIVDPLARFAGGDVEVDNAAATRMVQVLERYTKLKGNPTIIVAHHTRKQSAGSDGARVVADDMRGASGLKDGARFVAVLEDVEKAGKDAPRLVRFRVVKNNYGTFPDDILLARDDAAHGALRRAEAAEIAAHSTAKEAAKEDGKPPKAKKKSRGDDLMEEMNR